MDVSALVRDEAHESVLADAALYRAVAENLPRLALLVPEPVYVQDEHPRATRQPRQLDRLLAPALAALVVLIQRLLPRELEVLLRPVAVHVGQFRLLQLPLALALGAVDFSPELRPENFMKGRQPLLHLSQLVL